jgi:polyphosphate kinase
MGSADWMKRNLYYRIEVVFPILNQGHKKEIEKNLELQLKDNFKAVELSGNLENIELEKPKRIQMAQKGFYTWIKGRNQRLLRKS